MDINNFEDILYAIDEIILEERKGMVKTVPFKTAEKWVEKENPSNNIRKYLAKWKEEERIDGYEAEK